MTRSSLCASPTTSTESDMSPQLSPMSSTKLPTLQFAISSRRHTELTLPTLTYGLQLSMNQCETPHYLPGIPTYPEQSPKDKEKKGLKELKEEEEERVFKKGTRRGTLNAEAKNVLKQWMFSPQHFAHPYPSEEEKEELALKAGIQVKQLSNWFTNARKRLWQPVLRQSGVEVKNFLSTGRGGPRGNKLDVVHLMKEKEEYITECLVPVVTPVFKRKNEHEEKKKQIKKRKKEVNESQEVHSSFSSSFEEIEILAAASLLGLHQEQPCVY